MENLQEAFAEVCAEAKPAKGCYVSLYVSVPFYGGPEEGGWWGNDTELVAYQRFATEEAAEEAVEAVKKLAEEMTNNARREHGEYCSRQMDWLYDRGLDSDFLPEVDGNEVFFVTTEERPGSHESQGRRHYE